MTPTVGEVREARYPLLQRLELVPEGDRGNIHSVLLQPKIDFTIYLPPSRVSSERAGQPPDGADAPTSVRSWHRGARLIWNVRPNGGTRDRLCSDRALSQDGEPNMKFALTLVTSVIVALSVTAAQSARSVLFIGNSA